MELGEPLALSAKRNTKLSMNVISVTNTPSCSNDQVNGMSCFEEKDT